MSTVQQLIAALEDSAISRLVLQAGAYELAGQACQRNVTFGASSYKTLVSSRLCIDRSITIEAEVPGSVVLDAQGSLAPVTSLRVLLVAAGAEAELIGLNVTGGDAKDGELASYGGGLLVFGTAHLTNCSVHDNNAGKDQWPFAGAGGGLFVGTGGSANLEDCSLRANTAATAGGALFLSWGAVASLQGCFISMNAATTTGGAAYLQGEATLTSSYVRGNQAAKGSGLYVQLSENSPDVPILYCCTISDTIDGPATFPPCSQPPAPPLPPSRPPPTSPLPSAPPLLPPPSPSSPPPSPPSVPPTSPSAPICHGACDVDSNVYLPLSPESSIGITLGLVLVLSIVLVCLLCIGGVGAGREDVTMAKRALVFEFMDCASDWLAFALVSSAGALQFHNDPDNEVRTFLLVLGVLSTTCWAAEALLFWRCLECFRRTAQRFSIARLLLEDGTQVVLYSIVAIAVTGSGSAANIALALAGLLQSLIFLLQKARRLFIKVRESHWRRSRVDIELPGAL